MTITPATSHVEETDGGRFLNVDTRRERPRNDSSNCGPDCTARLLRYYGVNITYSQAVADAPDSVDSFLISQLGMGTKPETLAA